MTFRNVGLAGWIGCDTLMFLICIFVAGLEVKNGMLFFIRQCLQNPHIYRK